MATRARPKKPSKTTSLSRYGSLAEYKRKRDFDVTPEPAGRVAKGAKRALRFVIQKHAASRLHYDLRLEFNGVMMSWAVPKGPALDPAVKRLAMAVEDHPIEYNGFEGVIPEGEYGGGTVMIWDEGTWEPESPDIAAALAKGDLKFTLHGHKLHGSWVLVHTDDRRWLLIKHRDRFATSDVDVTVDHARSAVSSRTMKSIATKAGATPEQVDKAAATDPTRTTRAVTASSARSTTTARAGTRLRSAARTRRTKR